MGPGAAPRCRATLHRLEDKLLFILLYFKLYPLQEVMGLFFGLSQAQANQWIHRLTPVLQRALGYAKQLPERKASNLEQALAACPDLEMVIDGTQRRIQRPQDKAQQKQNYSGKKKTHTKKNVLISDRARRVHYLSGTYEGKKHDKAICDQEEYAFPAQSKLYAEQVIRRASYTRTPAFKAMSRGRPASPTQSPTQSLTQSLTQSRGRRFNPRRSRAKGS